MPRRRRYRSPDRRVGRVRRTPPSEGYLVRDLARLAGVSVHTIKRYVRHGLLAPVPFYGTATRYPSDYLVRLLALRYWRATGSKTLAELRRRQDSATLSEMLAWVTSHPLPAETTAALGHETVRAPSTHAQSSERPTSSSSNAPESLDATLQLPADHWQHWTLMPGLELHLKSDAAPITRQLAARLCRTFAALVSPQAE